LYGEKIFEDFLARHRETNSCAAPVEHSAFLSFFSGTGRDRILNFMKKLHDIYHHSPLVTRSPTPRAVNNSGCD
jgi:hypothetical protein